MCLDLGEELSEAKLKAIKVKVLEPPVMLLAGRAIPSQTYLLISSKNIPLSNVPIKCSSHKEKHKRFSSIFVTPASNVECKENRDKVFCQGSCIVEIDNLSKTV